MCRVIPAILFCKRANDEAIQLIPPVDSTVFAVPETRWDFGAKITIFQAKLTEFACFCALLAAFSTPFVTFVTNKLFAILALLCVQQFDGKLLGNQGAAVAQLWFSAPCAIFLWICDDSFGFFRFLCQGFPRNFLYAFRERWIYLLNYHICGINLMIYYVGFRLSQIKARFMKQSSLNPSLNFKQLNYT